MLSHVEAQLEEEETDVVKLALFISRPEGRCVPLNPENAEVGRPFLDA